MYPIRIRRAWLLAAVPLLCARAAAAGELVYVPVNPAFGGNNASAAQVLLSTAQATNKHKGPDTASPLSGQNALQQFNDMLERAVLGQLAAAATSSIIGPNGKLVPGTIDTGNFRITITDLGGGMLEITTTDKTTGATTSFQIGT